MKTQLIYLINHGHREGRLSEVNTTDLELEHTEGKGTGAKVGQCNPKLYGKLE